MLGLQVQGPDEEGKAVSHLISAYDIISTVYYELPDRDGFVYEVDFDSSSEAWVLVSPDKEFFLLTEEYETHWETDDGPTFMGYTWVTGYCEVRDEYGDIVSDIEYSTNGDGSDSPEEARAAVTEWIATLVK